MGVFLEHRGMALRMVSLVILMVALAFFIATADVVAKPLADHQTDVCEEHTHGNNTMDCTNTSGWNSARTSWWGRGRTDTTHNVDEIEVRVWGTEMCRTSFPEHDFDVERSNDDSWIVSVYGSGGMTGPDCYPLAMIVNASVHDASGMHHHIGTIDKPHPNRITE